MKFMISVLDDNQNAKMINDQIKMLNEQIVRIREQILEKLIRSKPFTVIYLSNELKRFSKLLSRGI